MGQNSLVDASSSEFGPYMGQNSMDDTSTIEFCPSGGVHCLLGTRVDLPRGSRRVYGGRSQGGARGYDYHCNYHCDDHCDCDYHRHRNRHHSPGSTDLHR